MKIDNSKIKDIFANLSLKVQNIEKIKTYSNYVAKIKTNKGNYFLKVYQNKNETQTGHKLSHLYPLLSNNKIPVPKVLKFDDSLKIIKKPYLIISEIKGEMLCDKIKKMSKKEIISFYHKFGKAIARIHSITFNQFGETFNGKTVEGLSEINSKKPFKEWKNLHTKIINYRLKFLKNTYFKDLIKPVKRFFKDNSYLIDYKITPRLLHIDLNQKNIFLQGNKISGIIDFDGAFIGHSEEELMRIEGANFSNNKTFQTSFFKGYTQILKLDKDYEKRRTFYYLSRLLVHVDCLIKYGKEYASNLTKEQAIVKEEIIKIIQGKKINFDKNRINS